MMNDPDKQELLLELWPRDAAASLRKTTLQRLLAEGRGRRTRRRAAQAAGSLATVLLAALCLWPGRPVPAPPAVTSHAQKPSAMRRLTEAEVQQRLEGFAVAYAGPPGARKIVLIEEIRR